ncbi:hypothetical protein [uncultured Ruminococcus sp.]|uniref:hypothetical protein n=1 Tax=uncultured Ruminococcus sp. TaxID=165186 RepID=UPI0025CDAF4A|nr:hypothetical protein [uncultured Ruminococcus sp.]
MFYRAVFLFTRLAVSSVKVSSAGESPMNALSAECVTVRKKGHLREVSLLVLSGCYSLYETCCQQCAGQQYGRNPDECAVC